MESQTSQSIFSCSLCSKKYTSKVRLDTHQLNCENKLSEMKMKEQLREEKRLRKQQEEAEKKKQADERAEKRRIEKELEKAQSEEKNKLITCEYCNIQFPGYNFPPHVSKCKAIHEEEKNKARKILEDSYFRKGLFLHPDGSISLAIYEDCGVRLVQNRKWILDGDKVVGKKETGYPDFCELNDAHVRLLEMDKIPYEKYSFEKLNELVLKAKVKFQETNKNKPDNKPKFDLVGLAAPPCESTIPTYEDYLREERNRICRTRNPVPFDLKQIKSIYREKTYSKYAQDMDESQRKQRERIPQIQFVD